MRIELCATCDNEHTARRDGPGASLAGWSNRRQQGCPTFLLICWRGRSECWQLLTRWPLTHASHAHFSPAINISEVVEVGLIGFGGGRNTVVSRRNEPPQKKRNTVKTDATVRRAVTKDCRVDRNRIANIYNRRAVAPKRDKDAAVGINRVLQRGDDMNA